MREEGDDGGEEGWLKAVIVPDTLQVTHNKRTRLPILHLALQLINGGGSKQKREMALDAAEYDFPDAAASLPIQPRNTTALSDDLADLVQLTCLNEPSVLHAIRSRFLADKIYTRAGLVLTSVNPYHPLPECFASPVLSSFHHPTEISEEDTSGSNTRFYFSKEPHIFAVAEEAYSELKCKLLRNSHEPSSFASPSQSIIISGESGAGKTVAARHCMRYFARIDHNFDENNGSVGRKDLSGVEHRVLHSNPILEAFGNAQTIRNDNSSRFGKYLQLFFSDNQTGNDLHIVGARIQTYLLEKSRIVQQSPSERNYHAFHQLLAVAGEKFPEWNLHAQSFRYADAKKAIPGVNDVQAWEETNEAMQAIGFSPEETRAVWACLAAILYLGNIEITSSTAASSSAIEGSGDKCHIPPGQQSLKVCCELLGVGEDSFKASLTHRKIKAAGESITVPLTPAQASSGRDALAKLLYTCLFERIVYRLNVLLQPIKAEDADEIDDSDYDHLPFIGVLDIYGFERFDDTADGNHNQVSSSLTTIGDNTKTLSSSSVNSFEQFCINYANERLQHAFTQQVFAEEQALYAAEGIPWHFVRFTDNQPTIDLIEGKTGILALLDEVFYQPTF